MPNTIALLGIPFDEYSSHARGAAEGPVRIREALLSDAGNPWTETDVDISEVGLIDDRGDLMFESHEDPWQRIEAELSHLLAAEERPLVLGGDHSITHPILRAVHTRYPRLSVLQIDAHPDLYEDFDGNPRSHASPFARVMEEGLVHRLVQIGIRATTRHQREQAARYGIEVFEMKGLPDRMRLIFEEPVYVSIDLDGLDPAFAPGVSHREPGGLTTRQVLDILHMLDAVVIGADIVELNPSRDRDGVTAAVAAKLAKELIAKMR
jgi:agmatinase